ncbi:MAG: HEAT repeat domain-containing protein [Dehalococcoidia bacterium]
MEAEQPSSSPTGPRSKKPDAAAQRLVRMAAERGSEAVPTLRAALEHPDPWMRLHAVEGLAAIDDVEARAGLAVALHDSNFGVHWSASRALAGAGAAGVSAVLRALLHDEPSTGFLHGAAYVLHHAHLASEQRLAVIPVMEALRRPAADLEAPVAAFAALNAFQGVAAVGAVQPFIPWYRAIRRRRRRMESLAPAVIGTPS